MTPSFSNFSLFHDVYIAGSQLELDEETVQGVLAACRQEIGYVFGAKRYSICPS